MKWLYAFLILTLVYLSVKAENDTATSTNILPNAGTTSSNMDNFNLDGVQSGHRCIYQTILHTMVLQLLVHTS